MSSGSLHSVLSRTSILIIHAAGTQSGGTECGHQILNEPPDNVKSSPAPDLCTPDDREWMGCHRERASARDQIQRLGRTRATCFGNPLSSVEESRASVASESNRGQPGNARLTNTGILLATPRAIAALPRFEPRAIAAVGALMKRNAANRDWQSVTFAAAGNAGR